MRVYPPIPEASSITDLATLARSVGFAVLRGGDAEALEHTLRELGNVLYVEEVETRPDSRALVTSDRALPPHTDHHRARWIVWACSHQADRGGDSLVVDGLGAAACVGARRHRSHGGLVPVGLAPIVLGAMEGMRPWCRPVIHKTTHPFGQSTTVAPLDAVRRDLGEATPLATGPLDETPTMSHSPKHSMTRGSLVMDTTSTWTTTRLCPRRAAATGNFPSLVAPGVDGLGHYVAGSRFTEPGRLFPSWAEPVVTEAATCVQCLLNQQWSVAVFAAGVRP